MHYTPKNAVMITSDCNRKHCEGTIKGNWV